MTIVIEDGTGLANANSYASESTFETYTEDRGITPATGDAEAALIRATQAIDAKYRARFNGYKARQRAQALEWPRQGVLDTQSFLVPANAVPIEIVQATCEAAIRELVAPGSMMPDLERGGDIRSIKAGSVAIDYGANASAHTTFSIIDGILSSLLGTTPSPLFASAVRG